MDALLFIQLISLIITAGAFMLGIVSLRHKWKREELQRQSVAMKEHGLHAEQMKNIEFKITSLENETEKIKKDREMVEADIYTEIKELKCRHETDIVNINKQIESLIREIRDKNEADHNELKKMLITMGDKLTKVCTQYEDHEKNHQDKIFRARK